MESREAYAKKFGEHLRRIREDQEISQRELALAIGSDKPTLSKIENGQMVPSVYFLRRICSGLGITEFDFFEGF